MKRAVADPARRIRAAGAFLRHWAAVLANPDRHDFRERSIGWLALALLLSAAAHLAVLSTLAAMPRRYGADLRLSLRARLAPPPAPARPAAYLEQAFPDFGRPWDTAAAPAPGPATQEPSAPKPATPEPAAQDGAPLVLPERYFRSRDLDVPAQPIGRAPLIYPQGAFHHRLRGVVRLRMFLGADGSVESVELVSVDPPGVYFEQAALEAIRLMRYTPALKDGQPVRSQKVIEVTFDPEEEAVRAARERAADKR